MLELYQAEDCPHSERVRDKLLDLGLSYVIHNPRTAHGDVKNQQTLEEMEHIGGRDQIPFLVDHRRSVEQYETDDIIEYLEEHYS